ncbi:MAG: hypothetical protein K5765_08220 [Clostridia bacterium]|nr:hypothetical protein [Clostridia bacterium]
MKAILNRFLRRIIIEKTFDISFNNYINDNSFSLLPKYKGIYLFKIYEKNESRVSPTIIYIGVASGENGLMGRVNNEHEHLEDARKLVQEMRDKNIDARLVICFSDEKEEYNDFWERIEAALIFGRKPILNTEYKKSFTFNKTIVNVSGSRYLDLKEKYIIE